MIDRQTALFAACRRAGSLAAIAALLLAQVAPAAAQLKPDFSRSPVEAIEIKAKRIDRFARGDGSKRGFGRLTFRGGLVLSSPSSKFGGWSGLELDPDGRRLLAVADSGVWMTGGLTYDGDAPSGLVDARIGPITGTGNQPLVRDRDRDAEGLVQLDGTLADGHVLIAFEQNHRIGRFPITSQGLGAPTGYLPLPPEARRQSRNRSLESVCIMRGGPHKGAVVTLAERYPDRTETRHAGWMTANAQPTAASWKTLPIRNIGGYDLTDCRGLADGSLLLLERRFRWSSWYEGVKARLRLISAADLRAGGLLEGEILLDVDLDHEIDNMEGLAVHRDAAGKTIVTMISDNNFNSFLQRTILLQFALDDRAAPAQRQAGSRP